MADRHESGATAYAVLILSSTSHALRAERVLAGAGIACKLIPVPRHLSSDCGVCLRIALGDGEPARRALATAGAGAVAIHPV